MRCDGHHGPRGARPSEPVANAKAEGPRIEIQRLNFRARAFGDHIGADPQLPHPHLGKECFGHPVINAAVEQRPPCRPEILEVLQAAILDGEISAIEAGPYEWIYPAMGKRMNI